MGRPKGWVGSSQRDVPRCPDHPGSSVVLNGTYGKGTKRQRFLCRPADGSKPHKFSFEVPRAFCYRNQERTNRMLELVRLRLNKVDDPLAYARDIRHYLDHTGGVLAHQGRIRDLPGQPSLRP